MTWYIKCIDTQTDSFIKERDFTMATLKDVAKDAGVSIATVSCCLSGKKKVKPETQAKIMDSIEKLKYIPNVSARNLKKASSKKIGIVLTDIDNSYHAEIFKGASAYLQEKGYDINVAFSNNSPDIECKKINDFVTSNVSGLLLVTSQPGNTEFFSGRIKNFNIPAVFIEHRPESLDFNFVGFNNYKTTFFLTESLLQKGYRNIALITGPLIFSSERDAADGYRAALQRYEITPKSDLFQTTNMTKEDAFKALLTLPLLEEIDAVIATSENIAMGIAEACRIRGIRVPGDIQILSFGEESWLRTSAAPEIIRTSRTAFTLGTAAAELLLDNIQTPVLFEEKTLIFSDEIIHTDLHLPMKKERQNTNFTPLVKREPLRILMVDLATSHSAEILSRNFTRITDVPVEIDYLPQNKMLKTIVSDMEKSDPHYDIYMYDIPWLEYMVQNGLVADITEYVESSSFNAEAFFPHNLKNCMYEDRYWGIPIVGGSQIMFYRRDLFENHGIRKEFKDQFQIELVPPRTWTEFNGIAAFFTRSYNPASPTLYGTSLAGDQDEAFAPELLIRLWSYGGKLWDKYNRVCLDSPENAQALRSIMETLKYVENPPLETSIDKTVNDFCSGRTAMLITYTEYANRISESIHDNIIGRVGYEAIPGRTPASVGWNLGLNPYTARSAEAYWYFQWLCRKDISIYMTILDGQSPAAAPYQSHELLKLYPWLELTEKSFDYCRKRDVPYAKKSLIIPRSRIEAVLCDAAKNVISGSLSLPDALKKGHEEMTALFKSYGYPKPLHFLP